MSTVFTSTKKLPNHLATQDQLELEKLSLAVAAASEVRTAREKARRLLLLDPSAQTLDGANGLERALDQWLMAHISAVVNNDPSRPRLFWAVDNTPRRWAGHIYPGAAVAIDNPDNVNRTSPLDGRWSYVLEGHYGRPATGQLSINVNLANDGQLRWGDAIATLTNKDIRADEHGRFTITLDRLPAHGRSNHLQLVDGPLQLSIRDSHADWRQQATNFSIRVVSGPDLNPLKGDAELVAEAAQGLEEFVAFWLHFKNSFWDNPPYNQIVGPNRREREGGWGVQAGGRFRLEEDQALVIRTATGGAEYTGFQISDPWTISPTPVYHTTSRNLAQSAQNPDGSYTYVISLVDPGVVNWIDTAGLHEGWFMLRWQNLPATSNPADLVQEVFLENLADIGKSIHPSVPRVDLKDRRKEITARIRQYRNRSE